jgi:uncharacterized protein (TIGR03437 family)
VDFYITGMTATATYCAEPACSPPGVKLTAPLTVRLLKPSFPNALFAGSAGSTLQGSVEVWVGTSLGIPIPNIALQANTGTSAILPNASCASPTGAGVALTNASGVATCDLVLNGVAGTLPLVVSAGGVVNFPGHTLTITPGPPSVVNILGGNNQIGTPGTRLPQPFVVQVTDAFGNPISGAAVNWQVVSGPMALSRVSLTTDSAGRTSATGMLLGTGGRVTVMVKAGSGAATFTALVTVPAAAITVISGDVQSAQINMTFGAPLVVQATDANRNPASFAIVNFSVNSGSVLLSAASVVADQTGTASITVQAGPVSGPVSILATSGSVSVTFSLTVLPIGPSNVVILNAASLSPGISPGGLAAIQGAGLTPTIQGMITDTSQMMGYSVTFGSTAAPILALVNQNGLQEIKVQVPFEVLPGSSNVIIQTPQGSLTLNNVIVSPVAPGIFTSGTLPDGGQSYPLAIAVRADGSTVTAANPAQRGQTITIFATGLGLTVPLPSTNVPGVPGQVVSNTVYAGVNHMGAAVISAVYQPGMIGVYAIMIQIPNSTMPGPAQPLTLNIVDASGQGYGAPEVYLPIQ